MLARQRQRVILSMLETQPSLRTIELAKQFDVTDETIRRDLEFLDSENQAYPHARRSASHRKTRDRLAVAKAPQRTPRS